MDKKTNRHKYHIHALRKFFETQFSKHDYRMSQVLMGHDGYMGGAYERFTDDDKKKAYLQGAIHLLVFKSTIPDIEARFQEQLKIKDKEMDAVKSQVVQMQKQISELIKQTQPYQKSVDAGAELEDSDVLDMIDASIDPRRKKVTKS